MDTKSIKVVSDAEAEGAQFVVCAAWHEHHFEDDVRTVCADCGDDIAHRPYAPVAPRKICVECFARELAAQPDAQIVSSPKMARELRDRGFRIEGTS